MNTFIQNADSPAAGRPTTFQAYPQMLYAAGLPPLTVQNEEQEKVARKKGYSNKPLAINDRPEPAIPLTTDNALRHAYETLKREHREMQDDFNRRYALLQDEKELLEKKIPSLEEKNYTLVQSVNALRGQIVIKNQLIVDLKNPKKKGDEKVAKEQAAVIAEQAQAELESVAGYEASAEGEPGAVTQGENQ